MQITPLEVPEVLLITPKRFGDGRGFFMETYSRPKLAAAGVDLDFVQDNHSKSSQVGVVRGLHFQRPPHAQVKLVRVVRGAVLDVAVDIRRGSPTYGRHVSRLLTAENGEQMLVPAGFAHGFSVLEPETEFVYKCSDVYAPECEGGLMFDDPDLGIDWRVDPAEAILSEKDRNNETFARFQSPFVYAERAGVVGSIGTDR